jgi:nucleoside-diphosphate-sugar epimerase
VNPVLVTGATGFVGRHAVDALLAAGREVHAAARQAGEPRDGVFWHEVDLLVPGCAEGLATAVRAEQLLHLAWYAAPGSFWTSPQNERWIDASLRLLRAFGEGGGSRAAMAGTCAEYMWGAEPLGESDTPLEPATLYGACKHATHVAAAGIARELGLGLAWGRIFFLYGPGEGPGRLVSDVARGLLAGDSVPTTEGLQQRDFMHVRDVAEAFVAMLASDVTGAINVASGDAVAVRDVVTLIAEQSGGLERVRFGALPERPGEPSVIAGETDRLDREVGFHPGISLKQGISETVAWWRERLAKEAARGTPLRLGDAG